MVKRKEMIDWLRAQFRQKKLQGTLVFDGSHRREEESGLSYPSPLEIAFTPKGQSADAYIIEQLSSVRNKKTCTVVTDDRGLVRHAQEQGVPVLSNTAFLRWLNKQGKKAEQDKPSSKETSHQMDRLQKIFEERLESEE